MATKTGKILVVDDNASIRQTLKLLLPMHFAKVEAIPSPSTLIATIGTFKPDVVLLDPMFPPRKKSALVKKKLQLLQLVEQPCPDEAALLEAALVLAPRKIVIKRPRNGPPLAGVAPTYSLAGRAVRFDCLVPLPPR